MIKRSLEHEELLENSVADTISNISKGDAFAHVSYSQSVSFQNDKLQSIDDVSHSSLACRVFNEGRAGNAFVNDPLLFQTMIQHALESSKFGESIEPELPVAHSYPVLDWACSKKNLHYNKQELKEIASELLQEIKVFAPNAKISTNISASFARFFLQNTLGFKGQYQESELYLQGGLFEITSDGSFLEVYEGFSFYDQDYDLKKITTVLKDRLDRSRHISSLKKSGCMPVIIAPSSMDLILDPIEIAANGKVLAKNLSLFADSIGQKVCSSNFSFIDDPLYKYGSSSFVFDDEGSPAQALDIINEGVFRNFIFDTVSAKKADAHSTGHASRSASSLPVPSFSNRIINTGDHSLEEMISTIDYGLLLLLSLGEGQSNVIAGDFSVLAETAFLIENGVLKGRVKDVMLSGNAFELLKNIPMIENKLHQESSLFAPHILLDGVMVSVH